MIFALSGFSLRSSFRLLCRPQRPKFFEKFFAQPSTSSPDVKQEVEDEKEETRSSDQLNRKPPAAASKTAKAESVPDVRAPSPVAESEQSSKLAAGDAADRGPSPLPVVHRAAVQSLATATVAAPAPDVDSEFSRVPVYKCRQGGCGSFYHLDCAKSLPLTNTSGIKNKTYELASLCRVASARC